jgi:hypothetical protein
MVSIRGRSGLRIRPSLPFNLTRDPTSDEIGIVKRRVTPDSPHSMLLRGGLGVPSLSTFQLSPPYSSRAPRDETAFAVAFVSSQESGLCITVVPFDRSPANKARCVRALEGGALISPDRDRVGLMDTFNVVASRLWPFGS